MDTKLVKGVLRRTRRRHSVEFKAQVVEACQQPGVSVAAIALANGLNANYLRRWIKEHREQGAGGGVDLVVAKMPAPSVLVPVVIQAPEDVASGDIRLDIRRGPTTVQLAWPVEHAAMLGLVLKDLLR
jgi:transposase